MLGTAEKARVFARRGTGNVAVVGAMVQLRSTEYARMHDDHLIFISHSLALTKGMLAARNNSS